jgi:hypothetical protein
MTADEIVSSLMESLAKAANADPRLQAAFDAEQANEALQQGMAVEGHIDFFALRELLVSKGAPDDVVRKIMLQMDAEATNKGLSVIEGLFQDAAAETVIAAGGFLPAAEIKAEKEAIDHALVAVVVRNTDLHVDMDEFRARMLAALDAALQTGDVDLEPVAQFLADTDTEESARHETLLTLIQLTQQGRTRYNLKLPDSMSTLSEAEQTAILDAFNKRCPSKDLPPPSQARQSKPEERKKKDDKARPATPAFVPPGKQPPKKKGRGRWLILTLALVAAAGVALWRVRPPPRYAAAPLTLPPGTMPCTQVLVQGSKFFCGMKVQAWSAVGKLSSSEREAMRAKTLEVAKAAGYTAVNYGLDSSK